MYKCTRYGPPNQAAQVFISNPHGSDGDSFFQSFPEIFDHQAIQSNESLFKLYIDIERDKGASELAHELAKELDQRKISSIVLDMNYPRGILDGGRQLDYCLRNILPLDLSNALEDRLREVHTRTLQKVSELYKEIHKTDGVLIDVHTMASFSPMKGPSCATEKESFESLKSYIDQFIQAPKSKENTRLVDIITEDGNGQMLADPLLRKRALQIFSQANIETAENTPYSAYPAFLMYSHMENCKSIAIDIPKHLLAKGVTHINEFDLDKFEVDLEKTKTYAYHLADIVDLQKKI